MCHRLTVKIVKAIAKINSIGLLIALPLPRLTDKDKINNIPITINIIRYIPLLSSPVSPYAKNL